MSPPRPDTLRRSARTISRAASGGEQGDRKDCEPSYNTGNEGWAYNDNINSPMMQDWLGKTVDRDDLTRHDKWCCMMLPRLKLLRELLRQDGAIFISIDDNEVHNLRCLMDEVFGEENFVATAKPPGAKRTGN